MPFPKKLLNDYETVALDLHPHWWFFAEPAASLLGAIVLGALVRWRLDGDAEKYLSLVVLALLVICVIWLVVRYLTWATTNFVITSDRLIFRQGIFAKSGIEMPLERVNNVNFSQSIFERMIGAGDLLIESGGEDGRSRFTDIRHPEKVQNLIHSEMEENERRRGGFYQAPTASGPDPIAQLERLEGMLQRGSITQAEFDDQKRKLLGLAQGSAATDPTTPLPPPPPPTPPVPPA